jgi:hypothetical protein
MNPRFKQVIVLSVFLLISTLTNFAATAQNMDTEDCATSIRKALDAATAACRTMTDGSVCIGNGKATTKLQSGEEVPSGTPGKNVALEQIASLQTMPINAKFQDWGIVFVRLSATTRIIMLGDATMTAASAAPNPDSIRAFTFRTGSSKPICNGAPNKILVQHGSTDVIGLSFNGAEVRLNGGSLLAIDADPKKNMAILVISGSATIAATGKEQTVQAGQMTLLKLGGEDGLLVIAAPTRPAKFRTTLIQFLPLRLLVDVVDVPAGERWTATGVQLKAGQSYMVMGSGLVKTVDELFWAAPQGHSAADCRASGRGDWDCRCRTLPEWGVCTISEAASMTLVGRVGADGRPFIIGAGGFFATNRDGELFLGPNDNKFDDNIGAYQAFIVVNASSKPK